MGLLALRSCFRPHPKHERKVSKPITFLIVRRMNSYIYTPHYQKSYGLIVSVRLLEYLLCACLPCARVLGEA
jgi:hypothetical protein